MEDDSTSWKAMDEFDDLVTIHDEIQEIEKKVDTISVSMKALPSIENMINMGETPTLQEKLRKLCREEAHYLKIV